MTNLMHKEMTPVEASHLHAGYVSVVEITIDGPPASVWPHVLNMGSWIYDFHFEHVSGQVDAEGEVEHLWPTSAEGVAGIAEADRNVENATVLKTLKVVPEKLWYGVNTAKARDGISSTGVNLVVLSERNGQTVVTAVRSREALCPTSGIRDATQQELTEYQPVAQFRWTDKYMPRLKELAEQANRSTRTR